jgi:predicted Rdx family selenoprotein
VDCCKILPFIGDKAVEELVRDKVIKAKDLGHMEVRSRG